jgi:flagellar basal body-associated protein FliL
MNANNKMDTNNKMDVNRIESPMRKRIKYVAIIIVALIILVVIMIVLMSIFGKEENADSKNKDEKNKKEPYATITPQTDNQQLKYQSDSIYNMIDSINRVQDAAL